MSNADRQARFRKRRQEEMERLRKALRNDGAPSSDTDALRNASDDGVSPVTEAGNEELAQKIKAALSRAEAGREEEAEASQRLVKLQERRIKELEEKFSVAI